MPLPAISVRFKRRLPLFKPKTGPHLIRCSGCCLQPVRPPFLATGASLRQGGSGHDGNRLSFPRTASADCPADVPVFLATSCTRHRRNCARDHPDRHRNTGSHSIGKDWRPRRGRRGGRRPFAFDAGGQPCQAAGNYQPAGRASWERRSCRDRHIRPRTAYRALARRIRNHERVWTSRRWRW